MKKILFILAAVIGLSACTVDGSKENPRNSDALRWFCADLVNKTVVNSVHSLIGIQKDGKDINAEGFNMAATYYDDRLTPVFTRLEQDCWRTDAKSSTIEFSVIITRKEGPEGRDSWTCRDAQAILREDSEYAAIMNSEGEILFDWKSSQYISSISYELVQTGRYRITTYRGGSGVDECAMIYTDGKGVLNILN